MYRIALKIMMGDHAKYLVLIFGVTFATLLIAYQVSIFIGLMSRTASAINAVPEADIWVMDTRVRYIEEVEPMRAVELYNVRGVSGVKWAVPFYKGLATIRTPDGLTQQVQLIGVDDDSLVGICPEMIMGNKRAIQRPQTAMMDRNGFKFTWPGEQIRLGKHVELNDNRIVIDAICKAEPTFYTFPILYVTYSTALEILPPVRKPLPFILVKAKKHEDIQALKKLIISQTGLQALTKDEFAWRSIDYVLKRTGIPINFGLIVILGIIIGAAITAQTFYIFVAENIRQFGTMKAIGVTNTQLFKMVSLQASLIGITGYSIGIGLSSLFFVLTRNLPNFQGFRMYWQVMLGSFLLISVIILFSIVFTLNKVLKLDPAMAFKE